MFHKSNNPPPPAEHIKPFPWAFKIYSASKVWHAHRWQEARDKWGLPIISRWIDYDNDHPLVVSNKRELWEQCLADVKASDMVILYCEDESEIHKGTIMECGHAMALGKPIYCIGRCETFRASPISDVAFTHHPLWHWTNETSFACGVNEALVTYKRDILELEYIRYLYS